MQTYEINEETRALVPCSTGTIIYEAERRFFINNEANNIINNSCEYYGSTFEGRKIGTTRLTGMTHKLPIIIEESKRIIFFPTSSPRLNQCSWLSLNHIKNVEKLDKQSKVVFDNYQEIILDISFGCLNNQLLRASRLESVLINRKY